MILGNPWNEPIYRLIRVRKGKRGDFVLDVMQSLAESEKRADAMPRELRQSCIRYI
jgi:hypothetical protein